MSGDKFRVTHPQYDAAVYVWRQVRDFVSGPAQVKRQNTLYLPMPAAMTNIKPAPDQATEQQVRPAKEIGGFVPSTSRDTQSRINEEVPWYYPVNLAYESYLRRARVPDITAFALRGLLGIATRKKPTIELPKNLAHLENNATPDGFSLIEMFAFIVGQLLQTGRIGLGLNVTEDNKFIFNLYSADSGINWKERTEAGVRKIEFAVLQEDMDDPDNTNPFERKTKAKYLVLTTDKDGMFKADIYHQDQAGEDPIDTKEPKIHNKRTKEIPFVFVGSIDNTPDVDESPLQGVADIAQHAYMMNADLRNAEFMTCNPMLTMIGVEQDEAPVAMGSNTVLFTNNDQAKIDYTKTDTSGLDHCLKHTNDLLAEAAAFGATLLGGRKASAESAETTRIHQSIGGATLQSAVLSAGSAIRHLLELAQRWGGGTGEVIFEPSTEFANVQLSSTEMTALMSTFLQGGMSLETLIENWRRAGLLQEGDTVEDELDRIGQALNNPEDEDLSDATNDDDEEEEVADPDEDAVQ